MIGCSGYNALLAQVARVFYALLTDMLCEGVFLKNLAGEVYITMLLMLLVG